MGNMFIFKCVEDVFPFATPDDESFRSKDLEPLRDRRHPFFEFRGKIAHAVCSVEEAMKNPQTARIPSGTKDCRRTLQDLRGDLSMFDAVVLPLAGLVAHDSSARIDAARASPSASSRVGQPTFRPWSALGFGMM